MEFVGLFLEFDELFEFKRELHFVMENEVRFII